MNEKEYKFWKEWIDSKGNIKARLSLMFNNKEGYYTLFLMAISLYFAIAGVLLIVSFYFVGLILEIIAFLILVMQSMEISSNEIRCELYERENGGKQ